MSALIRSMLSKRGDKIMATAKRADTGTPSTLCPWSSLDSEEQTRLREAYGHWLDQLPPTCSLETKIARFRTWLQTQGIDYDAGHATVTPRT
jgi:hypothetical protein